MTGVGLAVLDNHRWLEVRVLTDLTVRNATALRNSIRAIWEERGRPGPLILDLAGAQHIDSSGVGALLELSHWTEDAGVTMIIQGLCQAPRRMLERMGLGLMLQIAGEGVARAS